MAVAGVLEIQMRADVARLQKDMSKMQSTMKRGTDRMASAVKKVVAAFGALALIMGVKMFAGFLKGVIDAQDKLAKLSQKVNISVESLVGWQHAADLSGTSLDGLTKGMKSLTTQMFDANDGLLESARNFEKLQITVTDAEGTLRDADDVMIEIADKFALMEDGATKTALAVKIFGKAGLDMIPMLNQGSDALKAMREEGQLLNPVTAEAAHQSEMFNDNLERLTKSLKVGFIQALNELLPMLVFLTDEMFEARKQAVGAEQDFHPLVEIFKDVSRWAALTTGWIAGLAIQVSGMKAIFEATMEDGVAGAKRARQEVAALMAQNEAALVRFQMRLEAAADKSAKDLITADDIRKGKDRTRPELPSIEFNVPGSNKKTDAEKAAEAANKYLLKLQKIEESELVASEHGKALWEIRHGNLKLASTAMQDWILDKAKAIDLEKAHTEAAKVMKTMMEESALQQEDAMQETLRIQEAMKEHDIAERDLFIDRWQNEKETLEDQHAEELELLQELWDKRLIGESNFMEIRLRMMEQFEEKRAAAEERSMTQSEKFTAMSWQNKTETIFGELSALSAGVSTHSRKMFELNKVAGIAEAIINAYTGISKTLSAYPYPVNLAMAAAHAISAFAQVSAIQSTTFEGGGGGAAPSLAGSTPATPVTPVGASNQPSGQTTIINFQGTQDERSMVRRFAKLLNENTHDGGKVLVN